MMQEDILNNPEKYDLSIETVGKGTALCHRVDRMNIILIDLLAVAEGLAKEMSSVGSCIDQNVFRLHFQVTFDHCFQIFVFHRL